MPGSQCAATNHKPLTTNPPCLSILLDSTFQTAVSTGRGGAFSGISTFLWGRRNNGYPCRRPSARRIETGGIHRFLRFSSGPLLSSLLSRAAVPSTTLSVARLHEVLQPDDSSCVRVP